MILCVTKLKCCLQILTIKCIVIRIIVIYVTLKDKWHFPDTYVVSYVVHVMPPQVRSKVLAYLFEEKELLELLSTVQLARNDEIIRFYQFRKILIYLNSSCIAHTVRLNMKKGWKNELDLRPWFLASVDLFGHVVYGQQNHKIPNWQKSSKIREKSPKFKNMDFEP